MTVLIIICIYLAGSVGFYFLAKWTRKNIAEKAWTVEIRAIVMGMCLLSWIAVIIWGLIWLFENVDFYIDWDKPAKW